MVHAVEGSYWVYAPTKGVPILFAVLFFISGALHIYQNAIKFKAWRIVFFLPWAATLFVAGFALREYGCYHYDDLNIFIASQVLIFAAPPVYAAASYFIFGSTLYYIPYLSYMHPGRVFSTFLGLDAVVEAIGANGLVQLVNRDNSPAKHKLGADLVKASLILQLGMFFSFVGLVMHFHRRCKQEGLFTKNIKIIVYELYICSFFILFRNTFRTATFFYPWTAFANASEVLFYVFEVLPMFICTAVFNVFPPAKYLPRSNKVYLAKDGKTELVRTGRLDQRNFLVTVFDPMDFAGLIMGRDKKTRFWDEDGIGGPKKTEATAETLETPKNLVGST